MYSPEREMWPLPPEEINPKQNKENKEEEGEPLSSALTPEEEAGRQEVFSEVKRGLGELYELLPHNKAIGAKELEALLEPTELAKKLPPTYKHDLVAVIRGQRLNQLSKEEFISIGVEVLGLWIHTQALVRSAKKKLERSRVSPEFTSPTEELPPQAEEEHSLNNDDDN